MKKNRIIFVPALLLALALATGGCGYITGEAVDFSYQSPVTEQFAADVSVTEAYAIIAQHAGQHGFTILDVRMPEEFAAGHIQAALNRDYYAPDFKDDLGQFDKADLYIVYCRTGARSAAARDIMREMGFQHIYNMSGGITDWTAQGFPVVR
ncbi:MAG: rhodanese-like domain-containing protein [Dehalococcoidales bacterium]|jgi:rhodanese-related sulfurtransferase